MNGSAGTLDAPVQWNTENDARAEACRLLAEYVEHSAIEWTTEGRNGRSITTTVNAMPIWVYTATRNQNGHWFPMFVFCIGRRISVAYAQWFSLDDETGDVLPPSIAFTRIETMAHALPYREYPHLQPSDSQGQVGDAS